MVDGRALRVVARSPEPGVVPACTLWDGRTLPCGDPAVLEDLDHGPWRLDVEVADVHDNRAGVSRFFTVAPRTTLHPGPPSPRTEPVATFSWASASGAGGTFSCRVDGGAWRSCESGETLTGLTDGTHTFAVRQSLHTGFPHEVAEIDPPTWEWRVDTRAPVTTVVSAPPPTGADRDATIAFATDEPATSECSLDGGVWTTCTSPVTYRGLALGHHDLKVRSTDSAGHREADGARVEWRIDPPTDPGPVATTPTLLPAPPAATLEQRRAAAARGLKTKVYRGRGVFAAGGVAARIGSAVDAQVAVSGTVAASLARRRLRAFSGRVTAGSTVNARLTLTRSAVRRLRRAGVNRVTVRLRITLTDNAGVRLATRTLRVRLRS